MGISCQLQLQVVILKWVDHSDTQGFEFHQLVMHLQDERMDKIEMQLLELIRKRCIQSCLILGLEQLPLDLSIQGLWMKS